MKLQEKLGISLALLIAVVSATVLLIQGGPSLSFNALDRLGALEWYDAFHSGVMIYTAFHCAFYKKHIIHWALPFLSALILTFDMHQHYTLHIIFTGTFIIAALHTIVFNTKESLKQWNRYVLLIIAAIGFLAGYALKLYSVLVAEIIVIYIIGIAKEREQYGNQFMKFLNKWL